LTRASPQTSGKVVPAGPRLTFGFRTHIGLVRSTNEDNAVAYLPEDESVLATRGSLFAVADGMGGHAAGALASQIALDALVRTYYSREWPDGVDAALRSAYGAADHEVRDYARVFAGSAGMGTTLVSAVVRGTDLWVASLGDSRACLWRGGALRRLTTDHTLAEQLIAENGLTAPTGEGQFADPQALRRSAYGHQLTRCIGFETDDRGPDVIRERLEPRCMVLLASDGLTGPVDDDAIAAVLSAEPGPSVACYRLVDMALEAGGPDNVTVVAVRYDVE